MKKVLTILFAALMMTAVAGCNKEKDKENKNDSQPLVLTDNTLIYEGVSYEMIFNAYYNNPDLTLVTVQSKDTLEDGTPKISLDGLHIRPENWNKTVDLASPAEGEGWGTFFFNGTVLNCGGYCYKTEGQLDCRGTIDEVEYTDKSIFKSGTFSLTGNNDGTPITIILDGVLQTDKRIQMKLVSDEYSTEYEG